MLGTKFSRRRHLGSVSYAKRVLSAIDGDVGRTSERVGSMQNHLLENR